ncbi:hypothetical protein AWN88_14085 [Agrobacterium tumefaciens]|nr:hypothetical protein AWN88_14085 [Agrobacterium tumefaciens]KAJ34034.1 hypothetical protein BW45_06335 [Agrobacterium tumefaciens]
MSNPTRYTIDFLIEIAESAGISEYVTEDNAWYDVEYKTADGWTVSCFYDHVEFDNINFFIAPDGTRLDFWDWHEESAEQYNRDKRRLMHWYPRPKPTTGACALPLSSVAETIGSLTADVKARRKGSSPVSIT